MNRKLTGNRLTSSIILHVVIEWIAAWKFVEQIIRYFSKWIDFEIFQSEFQVWLESREIVQIVSREMDVSFVIWFVEFLIRWTILEQKFILQFILQLERIWIDVDCTEKIELAHQYHTCTARFYLRSWLVVIRRAHPQFNSLLVRKRILQSTPHSSSS